MTVNPGETVSVAFDYDAANPDNCPGCIQYLAIGVGNDPTFCESVGIPAVCPGSTSGSASGQVTAPLAPGAYQVYVNQDRVVSCDLAKASYGVYPDRFYSVATINVDDDENGDGGGGCFISTLIK